MMRLYDGIGPNPQIVRTFAAEKGLSLKIVAVDMIAGENRGEAYRTINPLGKLPALQLESDVVVTEVTAICELLEDLHPTPALIGANPAEKAETRMWVRRFDLGILEPWMWGFSATVARKFFASREALLSESAGKEVLDLMWARLREFDTLLAGRTYACGERFSLADILLGSVLLFGRSKRMTLPDGLIWVPDWLERLEARGTFAA